MKVLHIGPHKTGSTYLQREVFSRLSGVNYYGEGAISAAWRKGMRPEPNGVPLWSTEAALGWPYPTAKPPQISRLMILCADLGVTHVLAVKRDYPFWVRSLYFQTLNEGGREYFCDWYARNQDGLEDWRRLFSDLENACRKQGLVLKVMSWADLLSDAPGSLKAIADYLGCESPAHAVTSEKSNRSLYGEYAIATYVALNRIIRGRVLLRAARLLRLSPRQLIQNGRLGLFLHRRSPREIELPNELAVLDWIKQG